MGVVWFATQLHLEEVRRLKVVSGMHDRNRQSHPRQSPGVPLEVLKKFAGGPRAGRRRPLRAYWPLKVNIWDVCMDVRPTNHKNLVLPDRLYRLL